MNEQQTQGDVAYERQLLERLREFFLAHVTLPVPGEQPCVMSLNDFYRWYRYILAEGYGR